MRYAHETGFALALTALLALGGCGDATPEAGMEDAGSEAAMEMESAPDAAAAESMSEPGTSGLIDPETASEAELLEVPHINAELAGRLIAGRPYETMLEVDAVLADDLDEAQREEAYTVMFKPLDLNNASEEEILLIPGVGDRMAHEFDEYRPYPGIQLFREEIGKYVDEEEVARLEQYVRIP